MITLDAPLRTRTRERSLPGAPDRARRNPALHAPEELRTARLLIVDDDPGVRYTLAAVLGRYGYAAVAQAADMGEALAAAERNTPDLVLLDLWMPGSTGFDVLRSFRGIPAMRDVPILVLSGDARSEMKIRALEEGATDFVGKPFDAVEALLRIRNLLQLRFLHRASLRETTSRYAELVESASDMIYEVDASGTIRYANPATCRLLGTAAEELAGASIERLVDPAGRDSLRAAMRERLVGPGSELCLRLPVVDADGSERWLEHRLRVAETDGRVTGARGIARDVTDHQRLETLKDQLIGHVSHELRTPLTAIRASLGLLESGKLAGYPERSAALVQLAVRNADRLIRLVNDTLDLDRHAAGAVILRTVAHPIAALLNDAVEAVVVQAERADIAIVVNAGEGDWELDPDLVHRVLVNLLGNAIKFSPEGGTVWVAADRRDGVLALSVRDRGRGIPPGKLEAVFERFEQVDASDARDRGGTGLGLAISREIVQLHGGRIWAESVPGEGSTFRVELP